MTAPLTTGCGGDGWPAQVTYAPVGVAAGEPGGVVREDDEDLGGVAGPARVPLGAAPVRAITAGLREAMDEARRTGAVLAARGRDACTARSGHRSATGVGKRVELSLLSLLSLRLLACTGCGQDSPGYGSVPAGGDRVQVRNGDGNHPPGPSAAQCVGAGFAHGTAAREGLGRGAGGAMGEGRCPVVVAVVPEPPCNRGVLDGSWTQRLARPGGS